MKGKYTEEVRRAIDIFWLENKFPPTIRDLVKMVGVKSNAHCWKILRGLENVRLGRDGRPIPLWVDNLSPPITPTGEIINRVSVAQDDEGDWYLEFYAGDIRHGISVSEILTWDNSRATDSEKAVLKELA